MGAGFWCPGGCTGVQTLPLPAGYTTFQLEIGMHYNNPACRGVIELNGRVLFDNSHYADHQFIVRPYSHSITNPWCSHKSKVQFSSL